MSIKKWVIDPAHSEIQFKIKHLMITTVTGSFDIFEASIETTDEDFTKSSIRFSADVDSIQTGNELRDGHLKSADFFDAATFPKLVFVSSEFQSVDNDSSYELFGNLTIKDISKHIKLSVEFGGIVKDTYGNTKAGFSIHGMISREAFGLRWNMLTETGGIVVSDEVRIACEIQLIEQPLA